MANTDAPFGLRWVGSLQSSATTPPVIPVTLPAATICGVGSIIVVSNAGVIALTGTTSLGANNLILGISAGYKAQTASTEVIPCIRPHDQIFEVQAEETTTWQDLDTAAEILTAMQAGTQYGFAAGDTIDSANKSGMYLDVDTTDTTAITTFLELVGTYPTRVDNDITSQYANFHVKIDTDSIATAHVPSNA
jgi:hypothetical protein